VKENYCLNLNDNPYRTHKCADLSKQNIGQNVKLAGWVFRKRNHGGVLFIDLRDHYGSIQLVFNNEYLIKKAEEISLESVIFIKGKVFAREESKINNISQTGEIEVYVNDISVESLAPNELPIQVNNNDIQDNEENKLIYRYLYLRKQKPHENIILRSKFIHKLRTELFNLGFLEFQTPILTASSPEGARDFLVPSRLHPGHFYALPQAPQQFKQLLMISSFDKYFQIAPCFRDEDSRADRSPGEFYQLDIEMSFVTQEDVFKLVELVIYNAFNEFKQDNFSINNIAWPRISYKESMLQFGSDKPDLRNPLRIYDVTSIFKNSSFSLFANQIESGAVVRAIIAPKCSDKGRSFCDKKNEYAKNILKSKGLGYIIFKNYIPEGPIANNTERERIDNLKNIMPICRDDVIFFSCDKEDKAAFYMGEIRKILGEELGLIAKNEYKFCWVVDFPMYEFNEIDRRIDFSHNPFSMPNGGLDALNNQDPLNITAFQYDLVCNGIEISSGAIRNHKPEIMYRAFEIAGYSKDEVDEKFSGMINAFKFGAPPHGGIAPGVDRMIMLLADEPNIREIIAFPLNQKAQDLMMNAPSKVNNKQLNELSLKIDIKD
jgi:aspartyl-tRNA synthetase